MKILHIIFTFRTGGAETMLVDMMNRQAALGHDVALLIINDGVDRNLLSTVCDRVEVFHWPRRPGTGKLRLALRLNAWVRLRHPDAVHLHDPKLPGLLRGMDRKLVYTVHALGLSQRYLRPTVRQCAITDAVREDALRQYPAADVRVIPNGIDIDSIRRRDYERLPDGGRFRVVQSGRLDTATKGQDILVRTLGVLSRRGIRDVYVDFIGEGADRGMLEELARQEGVADRVTFRGLMTRKEVYDAYADYDLMVHPSRFEGFGLIIAEAMAAGLPVAVPVGGGPYEVIDRGHLGETFEPDDPESCADAVERVRADYPMALMRAELARSRASLSYSLKGMVDEYVRLYEELNK